MNRSTVASFFPPWAGSFFVAAFLLSYPTVTLVVHGGASAVSIAAALVGLCVLALPRASEPPRVDRIVVVTLVALASPLAATLVSEAWHGKFVASLLDAPSRFLLAIPILLALRRVRVGLLRWSDLSFALGAIAALLVLLLTPREPNSRWASPFLDAIHFGDIALVLGALSALSLNWWKKDRLPIKALKLVALATGIYASVLTETRGGWVAIPVVALLVYLRGSHRRDGRRWLVPLSIVAALILIGATSHMVRDRVWLIWSDLVQYSHGYKDTSTGVRLQLYEAAFSILREHLVFGAGPNGFADSMAAFAKAGQVSPLAADYGRGETHNQLLFYAANYGMIGALAGLALHVAPCIMFARYMNAPTREARCAAFMGLTFTVCFFIFGLSVETFDLKMAASFYAAVIGILGAIATSAPAVLAGNRGAASSTCGT
jgi:O-antigen ligase